MTEVVLAKKWVEPVLTYAKITEHSFNLDFEVIKSVELFQATHWAPIKIREAVAPFGNKLRIVKAKEKYYNQPQYKTHLSKETAWSPPNFSQVRDLFQECAPKLEYQVENRTYQDLHKLVNQDSKLNGQMNIRIQTHENEKFNDKYENEEAEVN